MKSSLYPPSSQDADLHGFFCFRAMFLYPLCRDIGAKDGSRQEILLSLWKQAYPIPINKSIYYFYPFFREFLL
nr:hypothetical protein BSM_25270 [uncultured archaeon]CBH39358.1 hypothetical protein BSM_28370 [uncultured archaeon]